MRGILDPVVAEMGVMAESTRRMDTYWLASVHRYKQEAFNCEAFNSEMRACAADWGLVRLLSD